jgi:hypothetical protein
MFSTIELIAAIVSAVATALGGAAGAGLFENLKLLIDHLLKRKTPDLALARDDAQATEALKDVIAGTAEGLLPYSTSPRFHLAKQQVLIRIESTF